VLIIRTAVAYPFIYLPPRSDVPARCRQLYPQSHTFDPRDDKTQDSVQGVYRIIPGRERDKRAT
jgi:hypothetical protein